MITEIVAHSSRQPSTHHDRPQAVPDTSSDRFCQLSRAMVEAESCREFPIVVVVETPIAGTPPGEIRASASTHKDKCRASIDHVAADFPGSY